MEELEWAEAKHFYDENSEYFRDPQEAAFEYVDSFNEDGKVFAYLEKGDGAFEFKAGVKPYGENEVTQLQVVVEEVEEVYEVLQ